MATNAAEQLYNIDMAFLDFIRNRQLPKTQPAPELKPQTARQMHVALDAQEQANRQPISQDVKSQADRVIETLNRGSFHLRAESTQSHSTGGGANSEPMRQKALNQDHIAFLLSPTTSQVGRVAETPSQTPSKDSAEPKSPQSQSPSQKRHGWER